MSEQPEFDFNLTAAASRVEASPIPHEPAQPGLDFTSEAPSGFAAWREQWQARKNKISRATGLIFDRPVEVNLASGITLQGLVQIDTATFLRTDIRNNELLFRVGGVSFRLPEIESCVTLDP